MNKYDELQKTTENGTGDRWQSAPSLQANENLL
jgi:hypothetical protein